MKKLSIAYFGTPYFSARFLEKCLTDTTVNQLTEIKFIVTQPDKPVGRKQILAPSPVKQVAEKFQIPIPNFQTNSKFQIPNFKKIDLALLFAYGQIIQKELLNIPRYGFWCIHPSLLPKYRGPSPIASPLILGDKETGVTLIQLDEKIDHGPIIAQDTLPIGPSDRRPDLEVKLTDLAFGIFKKLVIKLTRSQGNELKFNEQDEQKATYTKMFEKKDGFIPFENLIRHMGGENSPETVYNLFRGLYPWPGVWTVIKISGKEKRLKITDLSLSPKPYTLIPIKVQLESKKEVDFETFKKAYATFR